MQHPRQHSQDLLRNSKVISPPEVGQKKGDGQDVLNVREQTEAQ
jgi:hypothetical protein